MGGTHGMEEGMLNFVTQWAGIVIYSLHIVYVLAAKPRKIAVSRKEAPVGIHRPGCSLFQGPHGPSRS